MHLISKLKYYPNDLELFKYVEIKPLNFQQQKNERNLYMVELIELSQLRTRSQMY